MNEAPDTTTEEDLKIIDAAIGSQSPREWMLGLAAIERVRARLTFMQELIKTIDDMRATYAKTQRQPVKE